ncbi:MAG: CoA-binding protein [Phycisphaerae bacterium]|nr:MAG: CoA-binding protein [Planctomycetota bacterium]MBE7456616.1 CoA-binding protein [Planctomycetia bacterium]MCK6464004.1 CoA-binding protein [Phycisphaerae bacterium]MCL4718219.1 CoA-binding protein [Phycisphaerae bacterium]MCQ3920644.1 CoA-binding protein [Planctomycetota bacterium]
MTPQTVAVVGASADRAKYSNKAVRAYLARGWTVYPVNPKGGVIEGLPVLRSVREAPTPLHRVTLYLPPALGMQVLADIAAAKPDEFFVNPGAESDALVAEAHRLGLDPILACSIIEIGASPAAFPDA